MQRLHGAHAAVRDAQVFAQTLAEYSHVLVDLGTGDGRFVQHIARTRPSWYVIGVDACRENLRRAARTAPSNAEYVIANALALPPALHGMASAITINFPWGSLLRGLLNDDLGVMPQVVALAQPGATLDIHLNAGALAEVGWELVSGAEQVRRTLLGFGFSAQPVQALDAVALRAIHTTWAKRLAFGRDPRALVLRASSPVGPR